MVLAKTLAQAAELSGIGLHSGQHTTIRLCPAAAGTGLRFVRADLPGRPGVAAMDFNGVSAPFRSVLKKSAAEVHTVEHVLSALAGLGITDCAIETTGLEMPGMDGSAADFVAAIQRAGVRTLDAVVDALALSEPVEVSDGMATIAALPHAGGLKITYTLDYPGHPLAQGKLVLDVTPETYAADVARARTFAIRKDADAMRAAGLGKGANYENTVVVDGDRALETTLRFKDEPVRHKVLDLIGDLCLLGRPLHAHIVASCSGHKANHALVMRLREIGAGAVREAAVLGATQR
jgi:UDP-3-O-acyl N-acetylglucosamine deacetylase